MPVVRIAVASTPLTHTLDDAVPAAVDAVREAGRLGARIVCLPETDLPGHRVQGRPVPDITNAAVEAALATVAHAARRAGVVAIVGTERTSASGREIVSVVIGADGMTLGEQAKTQIDPTEEPHYVPGFGRQVFDSAGITFGIAICHEAFRYPEISRSLVLRGAQVIFVPHFVTTEGAPLPTRWCDPANPYNEQAIRMRALENRVYVAAADSAGPEQGSVTGIIDPDGDLVASLPYGTVGVVTSDIELDRADRTLALRWAPERNARTGTAAP
jgi:predicted amidohydrolase